MKIPPFAVSPEAAAEITSAVLAAERDSRLSGLIPVLDVCDDHQMTTVDGRVIERYDSKFISVGYVYPNEKTSGECGRLYFSGATVYVSKEAMDLLAGNELILETVEVGWPNASDRKARLLRSRSRDKSEGDTAR